MAIRWWWTCLCGGALLAGGTPPTRAEAPAEKRGLHIPRARQVGFTTYLQDGGGNQWDIQSSLNIGHGASQVYSGAMYCRIQGSNVHSSGQGWSNAAGDEIEIGPWSRGSVQVYRRCKVYKDQPLARWLDILVNTTSTPQTVPLQIYSCYNYTIRQISSSSGQGSFTGADWAFITVQDGGRPPLLHVVCGPKAKLRPSVRTSGNCLYVDYGVTVPAGGTAVVCYFEAQGGSLAALQEQMKKLRAHRLLKDLSPAVRKLIVNFRSGGLLEEVELDRSGAADTVLLTNGDAIRGRIANPSFRLASLHGTMTLPAAQVVGFTTADGAGPHVRAVLVNGQVITGALDSGALRLLLATGGELKIPYGRIRQCAYRIGPDKPDDAPFTDPLILLRNGDRLAFDADQLHCALETRHGRVPLAGKDLLEVRLAHEAHGVHRARFLNGSTLAGLLMPEKIALPVKLGKQLEIPRDMVLALRFAAETAEPKELTRLLLSNEDELFGRLADTSYTLETDFGIVPVRPPNVRSMAFDPSRPGRVAVTLWDGETTLRGRLKAESLRFAIEPGPELRVHVGQIASLWCPSPLPPVEVVQQVRKHVARLSAASYQDRKEAQEALIRMGKCIAPLLRKYLKDNDPEVRQRIRVILEQFGAAAAAPGPPQPPAFAQPQAWWGAQRVNIRR